ncbi:MAG TPA: DNA-formamidopyrimidine glycosylase family protein [Burkholderiaceae bacterium]|nr:DNA-formamidopyrimidine glycosylase family protein [Burkholderiaceae bacterium]
MPELPDVEVYVETVAEVAGGQVLTRLAILNPFFLRTVDPPPAAFAGRRLRATRRIGKRVVLEFDDELFAVLHLMIAGRLRWLVPPKKAPARIALAAFEFARGALVVTEAGSKRRASLHLVRGADAVAAFDPGGIELQQVTLDQFRQRLTAENHTLKRALTDPRSFAGIGNAYSDEILFRARLSPLALTGNLTPDEVARLFAACRAVLDEWTVRLREQAGAALPENVTAFRPEMAVHGKFGRPCPVCGSPVQRIVYAENETNYCARCQTGGRVLADRSLSRLLHASWPKSIDELG